MRLSIGCFDTVLKGLRSRKFSKKRPLPIFRDCLEVRVEEPLLDASGEIDMFESAQLDSRSMCLYGPKNKEGYRRFKIDHEFDISALKDVIPDDSGLITMSSQTYESSTGIEFVIIPGYRLKNPKANFYAVRTKVYNSIKSKLIRGEKVAIDENFAKINTWLTKDEVPNNLLWQVLALKSNDASVRNLRESSAFLRDRYVPKAVEYSCFGDDNQGMGVYINPSFTDFRLRSFFVDSARGRSDAKTKESFNRKCCFPRYARKRQVSAKN